MKDPTETILRIRQYDKLFHTIKHKLLLADLHALRKYLIWTDEDDSRLKVYCHIVSRIKKGIDKVFAVFSSGKLTSSL